MAAEEWEVVVSFTDASVSEALVEWAEVVVVVSSAVELSGVLFSKGVLEWQADKSRDKTRIAPQRMCSVCFFIRISFRCVLYTLNSPARF